MILIILFTNLDTANYERKDVSLLNRNQQKANLHFEQEIKCLGLYLQTFSCFSISSIGNDWPHFKNWHSIENLLYWRRENRFRSRTEAIGKDWPSDGQIMNNSWVKASIRHAWQNMCWQPAISTILGWWRTLLHNKHIIHGSTPLRKRLIGKPILHT